MNGGWYGYHSQSWVVYDIVLPTLVILRQSRFLAGKITIFLWFLIVFLIFQPQEVHPQLPHLEAGRGLLAPVKLIAAEAFGATSEPGQVLDQ